MRDSKCHPTLTPDRYYTLMVMLVIPADGRTSFSGNFLSAFQQKCEQFLYPFCVLIPAHLDKVRHDHEREALKSTVTSNCLYFCLVTFTFGSVLIHRYA